MPPIAAGGAARPGDPARLLAVQRAAAAAAPSPDLHRRRDALERLIALLHEDGDRLHAAISADFGHRAYPETALAELLPTLAAARHAHRHLRSWMRPRRRRVGLAFRPGRAWVMRQPLGCVGIVSPWNYPLFLSVGPLVDALAAGNRVLLKPSELVPRFADTLAALLAARYDAAEVAVVRGGPEVGRAFCALPFDHLLFTGSTEVGRAVMRAAADGLVPVTLELGGKSPAIVAGDADPARTARSLMVGKLFNAGQTCVAPDYALVPEERLDAFAQALLDAAGRLYPRIADNPDYTRIVSERHMRRLRDGIAAAAAAGAVVLRHPDHAREADAAARSGRLVPTVLLSPPADCALMTDEIFGPVLPVLPYRSLDAAIAHVNERPRPLALYCYTDDPRVERAVLSRTLSGGVTVNGTILHCAQPDLPFGGVGASGTGACHGEAGFERLSHARAVYRPGRFSGFTTMTPPHGAMTRRLLPLMLGRPSPAGSPPDKGPSAA